MKGGGYLLRVPSIDIAEVGAGGGSLAWLDGAGALRVGPNSAGAAPGPACYARGGAAPTITDVNLHMGRTNPGGLAGGTVKIRPDLATRSIRDTVADPLGIDPTDAAWAIRAIAQSSLVRALRAVSSERGRDPRRFTLFAFGGMGPVHALDVAAELGIKRVVVPPLPGLFSALGLLFAEVEHHLGRTHYADLPHPDVERLQRVAGELITEAETMLAREGYAAPRRAISLFADTRYVGQDHALSVALPGVDPTSLAALVETFHGEHEKAYGYRSLAERVQIVAVRCVGRGLSAEPKLPTRLNAAAMTGWRPSGRRKCYFGPSHGWIDADVIGRAELAGGGVRGPAIIEEDSSLTALQPGWTAALDDWSNIVMEAQ
jgi:N-methylhydantoinase A